MSKAWSGRFAAPTAKAVEAFTASIAVDVRLLPYDVRASKAHARMLAAVGLLGAEDAARIATVLDEVAADLVSRALPLDPSLEDVHMHLESALTARVGELGRRLHTARSRNDQVATAFRLWARDAVDELSIQLTKLQHAFVSFADRERGVVMPGYTHLQRAQPILAAHYALAHAERFARDVERLADVRKRIDVLPLGAAALAGTSLPIDRTLVANELGFARIARNSIDATCDRDFAVELLAALSLVATHLSSWAEEWILWSTTEFGFIALPDELCTGSSIMPQKKNPDVLELIRGRTGHVHGALVSLLTTLKGLPLAYNRDLQEDKAPVFTAVDQAAACLGMAVLMVDGARLKPERIAKGLDEGFLDATAVMEALIKRGVAMRTAHHAVGALVRAAEELGTTLGGVPAEAAAAIHPALAEVRGVFGVEQAVRSIVSEGGTGEHSVGEQLAAWKERLA